MDEFVIEWLRGQTVATITAPNSSALKGRIQKLSIEHPEDCKIIAENKDGSILAHIPIGYIKLNAPRNWSEESREKMSVRLKELSTKNRSNSAFDDSDEDLPIED